MSSCACNVTLNLTPARPPPSLLLLFPLVHRHMQSSDLSIYAADLFCDILCFFYTGTCRAATLPSMPPATLRPASGRLTSRATGSKCGCGRRWAWQACRFAAGSLQGLQLAGPAACKLLSLMLALALHVVSRPVQHTTTYHTSLGLLCTCRRARWAFIQRTAWLAFRTRWVAGAAPLHHGGKSAFFDWIRGWQFDVD